MSFVKTISDWHSALFEKLEFIEKLSYWQQTLLFLVVMVLISLFEIVFCATLELLFGEDIEEHEMELRKKGEYP